MVLPTSLLHDTVVTEIAQKGIQRPSRPGVPGQKSFVCLGMNDWDYETSKRNRDYGIRFVDDIHDARGKTLVRDDMWRAKVVLSPAVPKGTPHKLWRSGARSTTETKQTGLF